MDFRVTIPGLTFPAFEVGRVFGSDVGSLDCNGAGDAGMVLNLFLLGSDKLVVFVGGPMGRVLRGVLFVLVGRELFVVVLSAGLAGAPAFVLLDVGLLSALAFDIIVDLRLADDVAGEVADTADRAGDLGAVVVDIESLLGADLPGDFEFSSAPLMSLFLLSSTELKEDLGLWPTLGALEAVTLVGRRAAELVVSRVGGLLSPLIGSFRDDEEAVGFVAVLSVDVDVRLAVVRGRFGGIPFRGGDFCTSWTGVSCILGVSALDILSSVQWCLPTDAGRDSIAGAPSLEAIGALE